MISLTLFDFVAMSPLVILIIGALLLLIVESFTEKLAKTISFYIALFTLIAALFAAIYAPPSENKRLIDWLRFDDLGRLFTVFFLLIGIAATLLSSTFFQNFEASRGEYYFFLLSSIFGLVLIGAAADFLTLFLGIETLSLPLYILCGYMKRWEISDESALKYFLMGALASAFLVYGIALIYGATGTTDFDLLLGKYKALSTTSSKALFFSGISLLTLGLAFKAAIVPFHFWAPDVYEGAPTPVTAFMAVGTKVGAFVALIRVFLGALPQFDVLWNEGISLLAYPTLIYANVMALRQTQMRRFFAYSGISHAGFLLIPFAAGTPDSTQAIVFYLIVYAISTMGCFAVMAFIDHNSRGVTLHDLYGLFQRSPFLAVIFSLCLLTLAGVPPTAGFFAKFFIFKVGFQAGYYTLVIVALLATVLSIYYYLRIIGIMLTEGPSEVPVPKITWSAALVGTLSFAFILVLSFYPAPLLNLLAWTL